ncbi:hypothetical protein BCR32DRAFT_268184 [Anaeromyces robustus]|uniref:Uncharacterized protein n=1 Tax=Anaeromyces robustus TaxID=1754192 RepID=A0A1Y1X745_9FUNG|nr:hypothetical protein BCR32DRAFT_268184 [Anaeromyces robustus]|eukprot:ORX81590.1 hypothetical protein BCR32DRAFT_268184 [Anaeromyces robustus]
MESKKNIETLNEEGSTSSLKFIQDDIKSIRTKGKRLVFKSIFDSPLNYHWPKVEENNNEKILKELEIILSPLKEFNSKTLNNKNSKKPEILDNIYIGINSVTQALNKQINSPLEKNSNNIKVIIICKEDIKPTHLYSHFPIMAHLSGNIILCPLKLGSEYKLCQMTNLKKISSIALKDNEMCRNAIQLISSIYPNVQLPWIRDNKNIKNITKYFPTNMKILKTTAPIIKKNAKNNNNNNKGKMEKIKK